MINSLSMSLIKIHEQITRVQTTRLGLKEHVAGPMCRISYIVSYFLCLLRNTNKRVARMAVISIK